AHLEPRLHAPHDFAEQQAVGEERHVMPVLLERGDGNDHRRVFRQRGDGGPGEIREIHGATLPERIAAWPAPTRIRALESECKSGAGRGNRTLMASLEDWNFTIKLYPLCGAECGGT